jgi:TM2 domain-containing membrane protein YozV
MKKNVSEKSRTTTLLLSWLLGILGIHRFYVGKKSSGIIMLILSITIVGILVTAIWNFVDFITIACGEFKDINGKTISKW